MEVFSSTGSFASTSSNLISGVTNWLLSEGKPENYDSLLNLLRRGALTICYKSKSTGNLLEWELALVLAKNKQSTPSSIRQNLFFSV